MGVEFFLISYDLPGRTSFIPIYNLVDRSRIGMFRRLRYPAITREDSVASIVERMCGELCGRDHTRYSLDVLRIFAHGSNEPYGAYRLNGESVHIMLGQGLTPSTARAFQHASHLWQTTDAPGSPGAFPETVRSAEAMETIRGIRPRIEVHTCWATRYACPTLQALANAARAPVFAADELQEFRSTSSMYNWNLEGQITAFYP